VKRSEPLIMDAMIKLTEKVDRLQQQVAAAKELLEDENADSLHRHTGIPMNRCKELLEMIFDE
jgi:hypothetical protein